MHKNVQWASYSKGKCTLAHGIGKRSSIKCNGLSAMHTNLAGAAGGRTGTTVYFKQGKGVCAMSPLGFMVCGSLELVKDIDTSKSKRRR